MEPPKETFEELKERARRADILEDNLKLLVDAAAQHGLEQLFEINRILNRRGIKVALLEKYGLRRMRQYEHDTRVARRREREVQREGVKLLERRHAELVPQMQDQLRQYLADLHPTGEDTASPVDQFACLS